MTKSNKPLTFCQTDSNKLECEIDLDLLFETSRERKRFEEKWDGFLESNPHNSKIFAKSRNRLSYQSEQLIPEKLDGKPPLLLVLGNPASQSVASGMFFSFEGNGTEHRFWKSILKPSGILQLSYDKNQPVDKLNEARLKGSLKGHNDFALFCVPPTRLAGPCRRVLTQMFEKW